MRTRQTTRKTITLPGRYFTGRGTSVDVVLTDLSVGGCRFQTESARLAMGTPLQMMVANTGPHHARIKWVGKGEVGITFVAPLSEEQFEKFQSTHVPDMTDALPATKFDDMPEGLPQRFC